MQIHKSRQLQDFSSRVNPRGYSMNKWPDDYATVARKTQIAMKLSNKPCVGKGCDDMNPTCKRHSNIPAIVNRYYKMVYETE